MRHGLLLDGQSLTDYLEVVQDIPSICHESGNSLTQIQCTSTACSKDQRRGKTVKGCGEDVGKQIDIEVSKAEIFSALSQRKFTNNARLELWTTPTYGKNTITARSKSSCSRLPGILYSWFPRYAEQTRMIRPSGARYSPSRDQ